MILLHLRAQYLSIDGLVTKFCPTLATPWIAAYQAPWSMDFPGKNTGVGCHFLLQGIFPTWGLNPVSAMQTLSCISCGFSFFFFLPAEPPEKPILGIEVLQLMVIGWMWGWMHAWMDRKMDTYFLLCDLRFFFLFS